MNTVTNWIFHIWYTNRLKQQQSSEIVYANETDAIRSSCITVIINHISGYWIRLSEILYKLDIKQVQSNRSRITRDEFGKAKVLPNPVFSESEIATILNKWRMYLAII